MSEVVGMVDAIACEVEEVFGFEEMEPEGGDVGECDARCGE